MILRTVTTNNAIDFARLYEQAATDGTLVEIDIDTQQLLAITQQGVSTMRRQPASSAVGNSGARPSAQMMDAELTQSLETLLGLSWPVWKPIP